jgi:hypothetical protein
MKNDHRQNPRIRRVLDKLSEHQKKVLCLRLIIWLVAFHLRQISVHIQMSARSRAHWLGYHHRPRRLERLLLYLLFPVAMLLLEPREYATWAAIFGGFTAMTIPIISIRYILRAHQVQ